MFDINLSDFSSYDWQSVVSSTPPLRFYEYSTRFFQAAASLEEKGNALGVEVFRFLGAISSLAPNWSSRDKPFGPMVIMGTTRSADITDFNETDRSLLAGLTEITKDPQLRARFEDVACVIKFDHGLARMAARVYLEAARLLADHEDWPRFFDYLERAGQLAASVGKNQQEFKDFVAETKQLLDRFRPDDTGFACSKILEILLEYDEADPATYPPFSVELAQRAEQNKKFLVAGAYWQLAVTSNRRLKDEQGVRECQLQSAETHASEALEWLSADKVSHIAAAHHLSRAVFALRQAGAIKERVDELHRKLIEEQKLTMQEMGAVSAPPVD